MRKYVSPSLLIIFFILSAAGHYAHWPATLQFIISAVAVIFVAGFLGKATESVAHYAGQRLGGFLNATFGNAAELIIGILLVREGLFDMVKASITGSIIGNLLLVLGLSLFAGGLKHKIQRYNVSLAGMNGSLMIVAIIALFVPAIFLQTHVLHEEDRTALSLVVAGILIASYLLWLVFSMITHKDYLADVTEAGKGADNGAAAETDSIALATAGARMNCRPHGPKANRSRISSWQRSWSLLSANGSLEHWIRSQSVSVLAKYLSVPSLSLSSGTQQNTAQPFYSP